MVHMLYQYRSNFYNGNTICTTGNANGTIGTPNGTIGANGTIGKITNGTIGSTPNGAM